MVMTVVAVMVAGSGCGTTAPSPAASSKPNPAVQVQFDPQPCWSLALAKWIPGSYAKWASHTHGFISLVGDPSERRTEYGDLAMTDAARYEDGARSPFGIDGGQRREFAKLQQACGKLRLKVTKGQSSGHFFG